jgi:hypothetical protein
MSPGRTPSEARLMIRTPSAVARAASGLSPTRKRIINDSLNQDLHILQQWNPKNKLTVRDSVGIISDNASSSNK